MSQRRAKLKLNYFETECFENGRALSKWKYALKLNAPFQSEQHFEIWNTLKLNINLKFDNTLKLDAPFQIEYHFEIEQHFQNEQHFQIV